MVPLPTPSTDLFENGYGKTKENQVAAQHSTAQRPFTECSQYKHTIYLYTSLSSFNSIHIKGRCTLAREDGPKCFIPMDSSLFFGFISSVSLLHPKYKSKCSCKAWTGTAKTSVVALLKH
ncbi:hypothetical protein V6N13_131251 [Hibiscus sabdariffa]|uniref:Uncharacterized protein n=1 Tax=Hibiscus sabdariffa TaxID=183260 RepID=A0ABR2DA50_9ROSI